MLDFIKAVTKDQNYINRLYRYAKENLQPHKPQNNNYLCYSNGTGRFRLEFRKIIADNQLQGFYNVEVCFSPHYLFNDDLHNGNDLTPLNCVSVIRSVFEELEVTENEMQDFRITNIEYGLNIIPETDIKHLINGIIYTKKTPFKINAGDYSKISNSTKYKEVKAYAKGLQFADFPQYSIHPNTFRFEVRTKQHKNICRFGINTISDLLEVDKYNALFQSLISEWDNILLLNLEVKNERNKVEFWDEIVTKKYRNKFVRDKAKYYKNLPQKFNLHHQIKCKIIDKINTLCRGANSTQKTPINREKQHFKNNPHLLINLENAPLNKIIEDKKRLCKVTNLDISMQQDKSYYLCFTGLRFYHDNQPNIYKYLCKKYLRKKGRGNLDEEIYYIAHNIRNAFTNAIHNRRVFEQRNYPPGQLRFDFGI